MAANSTTFWSFAGAAFFAAAATLIALAAKDLGVVSETTSILQTFLPGRKSTPEQIKHDERGAAAPDGESAVLVLARRLEEADKLTEAKYAYRLAAEENDDPYALFWLGQQSIEQQKYEEGEEWLLKAMKRGNVDAAFLLGTLAPDGKNSTQHDIAPSKPVRLRLGPPRWAAELGFSLTDSILGKLTQGPTVTIDRPPPPAAPKSDHRSDRPCHPK